MKSGNTTKNSSNKEIINISSEPVPNHLLYDTDMVSGSLGDFIADVMQWLYNHAKTKYSPSRLKSDQATVLCIDNEEMIQVALAEYINKNGCKAIRAMNSDEAYAALDKKLPDLIFLDIHMPGDDTLALLKSFKANPKTKNVPVIVVTASNDISLISTYLEAGAEDYFLKSQAFNIGNKQAISPSLVEQKQIPKPETSPTEHHNIDSDIENILILLNGASQKLEKNLTHECLEPAVKHDLNNVQFGMLTAKKMIEDHFHL